MLDLAISGVEGASAAVSARIADHAVVTVGLNLSLPRTASQLRKVWSFVKADWEGLNGELQSTDWNVIDDSTAAKTTTSLILESAAWYIPQRALRTTKRSHPWLTDNLVKHVAEKQAAAETPAFAEAAKACSSAIIIEYDMYCTRSRQILVNAQKGSKQWWGLSRELLLQKTRIERIPALKSSDGRWLYEA